MVDKEKNKELQYIEVEKNRIDWKTAEHLIQYRKQYEYAIEIKYNANCEKKKGSAIFIHCSVNKPTSGCIAIPTNDMEYIIKNMKNNTYIYIY